MCRIPTLEQTMALIEEEIARADRSGNSFCLLLLSRPGHPSLEWIVDVSKFLQRRLRRSDDFGFWESRQLGVLLPFTSAEGGRCVATDIRKATCEQFPDLAIEVYTYPSNWLIRYSDPAAAETFCDPSEEVARPLEPMLVTGLPTWKRSADVTIAALGLVLLSPVFLVVAVLIRRSSPGPVFYRQLRSGLGGRPFHIYKFRTMIDGADGQKELLTFRNEQDGPAFKIKDDPRITAVGRLLRQMNFDELPQLINVLWGDMSLVGPRPLPCEETLGCSPWQQRRLTVTPGMTGLWQIAPQRNDMPFHEWMRLDLRYMGRRSLWRDMSILLRTLWSVFFRRDGC
jgi:lipopolysaccharide/colanic/teichoic acid biosynthesis glycosyltransferase